MGAIKFNFWSLTKNYYLVFPRIQRDYAQGRLTFKASQVRKSFIKSLKTALSEPASSVNLDFIYGVQEKDVKSDETQFIPLDGQQRLTTLFLLHMPRRNFSIQPARMLIMRRSSTTRHGRRIPKLR